jgi:serine protease
MPVRLFLLAASATLLLAAPGGAAAASPAYVPGELLVKYRGAAPQRVELPRAVPVRVAVAALRSRADVDYAAPNPIARASAVIPNDPSFSRQWHLGSPAGVRAPEAWELARRFGAPGGRGAVIAVLDTGVAFQNRGSFRRAPDLGRRSFVRGYDFFANDRHPDDENGHGTWVASAIAEATGNGRLGAGLAYRARIMPLRVLNRRGEGDSVAISRALRHAARRRVDVINLSLEFSPLVQAADIPEVLSAIRYAARRGVTIVAATGNGQDVEAAYPARSPHVIGVGATTHRLCQAFYSNGGPGLDISAPGGGGDAELSDNPSDQAHCRPDAGRGLDILHQSYACEPATRRGFRRSCLRRFGLPPDFRGTSMAAPQVSAAAAMVMATRVLGRRRPSPGAVLRRLQETARDLGPVGFDSRYGAGLLDAAAALDPSLRKPAS